MKLVMFDIDGTLTRSVEADEACFVRALREVHGFAEVNLDWSTYPHYSDGAILETLFRTRLGRAPSPAEVSAFQAHFLSLLGRAAAERPICPVPGARDFLGVLMERGTYAVSLASGAWECSARLKLSSAGLDLAHFPAAFADDAYAREDIMRASLARAARSCRRDAFDGVIYVGDGVWDARASRNLGYGFIGIAHERARVDRLYAAGARHVFADYRDAAAILAVLDHPRPPHPAAN